MATKDISSITVCRCVAQMHRQGIKPGWRFDRVVELLAAETGEARKVCEAAIDREIRKGLVEWGIGFSIGWLTHEGIALLEKNEGEDKVNANDGL